MMKRVFMVVLVLASVSLLFSCAATGPKFFEYSPQMHSLDPEMGRIFFFRPSSFGAALKPDVLLNGEKVGKAVSWGFFYVDRPAGEYEVLTATEVKRKVTFILEKGSTRYIRFSTNMGFFVGHVYGELVDETTAMEQIGKCGYTGEDKSASSQ